MIHNMWQYISLNNKCLTNTFVNKEISQKYGTFSALGRSQINILILNKAQKMAWVVPLINIYNMSTNNWTSNNHLTNTDCEWKSVTHGRTDRRKLRFSSSVKRSYSELKILVPEYYGNEISIWSTSLLLMNTAAIMI